MVKRVAGCLMVLCLLVAVPAGAAPAEREVGERWSFAGLWEWIVAWAPGSCGEESEPEAPTTTTNGGPGEGDEDGGPETDPGG